MNQCPKTGPQHPKSTFDEASISFSIFHFFQHSRTWPAPLNSCPSSAKVIMADHAVDDFDGDIFIYRGGRAPQHITHVLIDETVDGIEVDAFDCCENLLTVDTHDGLRRVGEWSFNRCRSLSRINIKSAIEIGYRAFYKCGNLESVEFGDSLEIIGAYAFDQCSSLKTPLKLPSIITIGSCAFYNCKRLIDAELSEQLETIASSAFRKCERLQRIAIPLKRDLFELSDMHHKYNQFDGCEELTTVSLVGGVHKTVSSLHMESWRTEMIAEINRINQVLSNTPADGKTFEIRQWMELLIDKMDHYKFEHYIYVKEGVILLELALWKAKLGEKGDNCEEGKTKQAKIDAASARNERRITCGADMVIKNVLPFLQLE